MTDPEPNTEIVGSPAIEAGLMKRIVLNQIRLPELAKRVKELEKQLGGEAGRGDFRDLTFLTISQTKRNVTTIRPNRDLL